MLVFVFCLVHLYKVVILFPLQIREKEMKTYEENDPAISQAKRRRKIISMLPKIFDMIHFFFQSINRSVITKEELIYRLVQSNVDIIDKSNSEFL